jgi:hypothetical protein
MASTDFAISRFTPAIVFETNGAPDKDLTITTGFRLDFPKTPNRSSLPSLGLYIVRQGFKLPSFNALGDPRIGNRGKPAHALDVW